MKKKILDLLNTTNILIANGKQIEKLKGEKFNLFSIMNMEEKEVNTHSAFLNELLNPKGSHLMGDIFLKLFIKMLNDKGIFSDIKTGNAISKKEEYISQVNYKSQNGGSIDIFISDRTNSISIENKIYAKDQDCQLVRYYKYNTENNLPLYLTLDGRDVTDKKSILITNDYKPKECENAKFEDKLIVDCHYFLISYKKDILIWLNQCLKESSESPILRESIKQYIILIKKLTNTMNENEQKDLENLIVNNRDAAKFIYNNYANAINKVRENLRISVIQKLIEKLGTDYIIVKENEFPNRLTQVWINYKKENQKLCFGIETFSGNHSGEKLFVGMFKGNNNELIYNNKVISKKGDWWIEEDIEYFKLDLFDTETLKLLNIDNDEISNSIVIQCIEYINAHLDFVKKVNGY